MPNGVGGTMSDTNRDARAAAATVARVHGAARRMRAAVERGFRTHASTKTLREEQMNVFRSFLGYLEKVAEHMSESPDTPFPFARFIQPPRTGKTVIIADVIAATGATALYLVPTKDLAEQAVRKLHEQVPGLKLGIYYSDAKMLVRGGVNVVTYQSMLALLKEGSVPSEIRESLFVFCDEGHRAMSEARMAMLRDLFLHALVIACTATPDFDEERTLGALFPYLIHEITLPQAVALDLFAPLSAKVLSLGVDGSFVSVRPNGDYDKEALGKVMSTDPFLEATRALRYDIEENRGLSALVTCTDRAQANRVHDYLVKNRPPQAPEPKLMLGTTTAKLRREMTEAYDARRLDTFVAVDVLTEGWDSVVCKLLIDLAPGLSEVVAKQKYFRVLTKNGSQGAKIYVLLPENLVRIPVVPQALFGLAVDAGGYEAWLDVEVERERKAKKRPWPEKEEEEREKKPRPVKRQESILHTFSTGAQLLDPKSWKEVREVIESAFEISPGKAFPSYRKFSAASFGHGLFQGFGLQLLRYCGVPRGRRYYVAFLRRLYPAVAAAWLLRQFEDLPEEPASCEDDVQHLLAGISAGEKGTEYGWHALAGPDETPDLDEAARRPFLLQRLAEGCAMVLTERQRYVLSRLFAEEDMTLGEVGKEMGLSRERVRQISLEAFERLRLQVFHLTEVDDREE
jgi:superfamily II DNA or RNA helicase